MSAPTLSHPGRHRPAHLSPRKAITRRRRVRRLLLAAGFTAVLGVLGAVAAFAIGYALTPMPDPNKLVTSNTTLVYYADSEEVLGSFAAQNRITVTLDQVPRHVQDAILAAENRTFWTDPGISLTGMLRAGWATLTGGSVQGGSTITQQYVKNYYLTQERTWSRKLTELFITIKVDRQLSKAEILQNYLNTIYFGRGAYGIETAAQAYFNKGASELTPEEGAVLAAVVRAPNNYDPAVDEANHDRLVGRFSWVMEGLATIPSSGVTAEQAEAAELPALAEPRDTQQYEGPQGHLLHQVRVELAELGFTEQEIDAGGLRVQTTFDKSIQQAAAAAVEENYPEEDTAGVYAGLAAIRPGTGEVVALYGGPDYVTRSFNDATQAKFEPGSTLKSFALAAAFEQGIDLDSRFAGNSGLEVEGGHKVNNESDRDYGETVDLLEATKKSINTAYVDLTVNELGPDKVVDAAVRAGIPADSPGLAPIPLVALGNAAVTPVDLANAYATLAAGGRYTPWHVVTRVTSRTSEVLYQADPAGERVFSGDVVADVSYALQQVVEEGTGQAAQAAGRPVAGKTGNHEGITAWFAGYAPQLTAAVGFYREDEEGNRISLDGVGGMSSFTGGGYPTQIWGAFMAQALKGEPVEEFPEPTRAGATPTPRGGGATIRVRALPAKPSTPTPTPTPTPEPSPTPTPTATTPSPEPSVGPPPLPTPTAPTPTPTPTDTASSPAPTETGIVPDPPDPDPTRTFGWPRQDDDQ